MYNIDERERDLKHGKQKCETIKVEMKIIPSEIPMLCMIWGAIALPFVVFIMPHSQIVRIILFEFMKQMNKRSKLTLGV